MRRIEVVRRDAEVGQHPVHLSDAVIAQEGSEITEVAADKDEPRIVGRGVGLGVGVLIESEKSAVGAQSTEDGTAMAAAAEGDVYIDAIRRQVERLQTFVEQGGDVVIVSFSIHHLCGVC